MSDTPQLRVNRQHFADGLHMVGSLTGLGRKPSVWTFADGQLSVILGDLSFQADGVGHWPGRLEMKAANLRGLGKIGWPPVEELELRVVEKQLHVVVLGNLRTTYRFDAKWIPTDE